MALRRDVSKQDRWLQIILRWQRSQVSIREFCRRYDVSEASFFSWRRVLRERGLLVESTSSQTPVDTPVFVKLTAPAVVPVVSPIELVLSQGRLLRVRPGFD